MGYDLWIGVCDFDWVVSGRKVVFFGFIGEFAITTSRWQVRGVESWELNEWIEQERNS